MSGPDAGWGRRVVAVHVGDADPAELLRTSTGEVRRLDLPGALGL